MNREQRKKEFLQLFKTWYDPHGLIIKSHHMVNTIAKCMVAEGYSVKETYQVADEAREYWDLPKIERKELENG